MPYKDNATRNAARAAKRGIINAKKRARYANEPILRQRRLDEYRRNAERYKDTARQWREKNPDRVKESSERRIASGRSVEANRQFLERNPGYGAKRYHKNKAKHGALCRQWSKKNPEHVAAVSKAWQKANREKLNQQRRDRNAIDPQFRVASSVRTRLWWIFRGGRKPEQTWDLVGCSLESLVEHLKAQFTPGMTVENFGRDGWHIDHIRPLASFDLTDPEQVKVACHYTNLQPLWATDNMSKGAKWEGDT